MNDDPFIRRHAFTLLPNDNETKSSSRADVVRVLDQTNTVAHDVAGLPPSSSPVLEMWLDDDAVATAMTTRYDSDWAPRDVQSRTRHL